MIYDEHFLPPSGIFLVLKLLRFVMIFIANVFSFLFT